MTTHDYITTHDVARLARVTSSAVRQWVAIGTLTAAATTPGGHFRFDPDEVARFLARDNEDLSADIDRSDPAPLDTQLARILRERIRTGDLARGRRIPSMVTLAKQYGLKNHTVHKAIRTLRTENLLFVVRGKGTFVHPDPQPIPSDA